MAEGKDSFLLYRDIKTTVDKLPLEKRGELFTMILDYVNDLNPTTDDLLVDVVFEPIKQRLKRDLRSWDETRLKRSESGRIGGLKSGETRSTSKQNEANEASASKTKQNEANEAVLVSVSDSVIVSVPDNVHEEEYHITPKSWRNDYETYLSEIRIAYSELTEDKDWIKKQELYHPKVNIPLSIEKSCVNYWATDAGWKKKKRTKSVLLDWKSTLTNAIDMNKVYK